jgi:heme exporter protein C
LVLAAVVSTLLAATLGVLAPPDAVQGSWQKLMYVHVPAAWTAYLAFVLVLVASVAFLRTGRPRFDAAALAAAEIGVVATSVALVTGSIWGRAVWGVWWTWDARLVSTALMLVLYVAYLGVRGLGGDVHDVRRLAAWVAIVAFADVPVVHFSVLWWRTLHQPPTILAPRAGTPPIDARMAVALLAAVLAACLVAAYAFVARVTRLLGLDRPAKDRPARLALVPPPVVPAPAEPVEPVARPADPVPR